MSDEALCKLVVSAAGQRPELKSGPRKEGQRLLATLKSPAERKAWEARARGESLSQIAITTAESFRSALRTWRSFAVPFGCLEMPPRLGLLMAWSRVHRSAGTYKNYLGHLRRQCLLLSKSTAVFDHPCLVEVRKGLKRTRGAPRRAPQFIRLSLLELLAQRVSEGKVPERDFVLLLVSYVFMLRMPSEAVQITFGGACFTGSPACLVVAEGRVKLRLAKRKNWQAGAPPMYRTCWCRKSPSTCPVCVLGRYAKRLSIGSQFFPGLAPHQCIGIVRACLVVCGVPEPGLYGTHDLRRGHALDMVQSGHTLAEILLFGQWRGAMTLAKSYLPFNEVEAEAVLRAVVEQSDSEPDGEPAPSAKARRQRRRPVSSKAAAELLKPPRRA